MIRASNHITWEAKAGESQIQVQSGFRTPSNKSPQINRILPLPLASCVTLHTSAHPSEPVNHRGGKDSECVEELLLHDGYLVRHVSPRSGTGSGGSGCDSRASAQSGALTPAHDGEPRDAGHRGGLPQASLGLGKREQRDGCGLSREANASGLVPLGGFLEGRGLWGRIS